MSLPAEITEPAAAIASILTERGEWVAVAESSAGGLISAALLSVPGASAYYRGGMVLYTLVAARARLGGMLEPPSDVRGASEPYARFLAEGVAGTLGAEWGVSEAGAAGP